MVKITITIITTVAKIYHLQVCSLLHALKPYVLGASLAGAGAFFPLIVILVDLLSSSSSKYLALFLLHSIITVTPHHYMPQAVVGFW